jgi:hypothetical protein
MDQLLLTCSNNAGKIKLTAAAGNADSRVRKVPGQIHNLQRMIRRQGAAIPAAVGLRWQKQSGPTAIVFAETRERFGERSDSRQQRTALAVTLSFERGIDRRQALAVV